MEKIAQDIDVMIANLDIEMLALRARRERLQKAKEALVGPPTITKVDPLPFVPNVDFPFVPSQPHPMWPHFWYPGGMSFTVVYDSGLKLTPQPPGPAQP